MLAGVGFFVMNFSYFSKQIAYLMAERTVPDPIPSDPPHLPACLPADRLVIESLGIEAPIVYVSGTTHRIFQEGLTKGVVHFPGTAKPGEFGNVYLFGHSSDFPWKDGDYKTVFALLPNITTGEKIRVSDPEGRLFTYAVTSTLVVGPKDVSVLDQHEKKTRMLSLQTSYPLGTALRRFIVQADFVEETMCERRD